MKPALPITMAVALVCSITLAYGRGGGGPGGGPGMSSGFGRSTGPGWSSGGMSRGGPVFGGRFDNRGFGGFGHGFGDRDFGHRFGGRDFDNRFGFGIVIGGPLYWWDDYPWCPPGYYYSGGYYYPYDSGYAAYPAATVYIQPTTIVYDRGVMWAQDLRRDIVSWDTFVAMLRGYWPKAPASSRDEFRRGFMSAYGENAAAAFDKAIQQTMPPPVNVPVPPPPH